jgi:hypothetical protein
MGCVLGVPPGFRWRRLDEDHPTTAWTRARARRMLSHCSNVGGSGHVVAMTCESVRSSSRRCHAFVSSSQSASKQRGTGAPTLRRRSAYKTRPRITTGLMRCSKRQPIKRLKWVVAQVEIRGPLTAASRRRKGGPTDCPPLLSAIWTQRTIDIIWKTEAPSERKCWRWRKSLLPATSA